MITAIGMIELTSIAKGIEAADAMIKSAHVELLAATAVCPGKYFVIINGSVSAVESAVNAGKRIAGAYLVDEFVLSNVHPSIFPAITSTTLVTEIHALGILESFSIATMIFSADAALKAAEVEAIELRLGSGMGGKSYLIITGDVASVEASIEAGAASAIEKGLLVEKVIIPSPAKELLKAIL
jgi:microcompartment protein CcmL/EutN